MSHVVAERPRSLRHLLAGETYRSASVHLQHVFDEAVSSCSHYYALNTVTRSTEAVEARFHELADRWRDETMFVSSTTDLASHPAYQEIIALGYAVVPLLLREIQTRPDHWFDALRTITGENPVPTDAYGDIEAMARAWLRWARDNHITS